MAAPARSDLVEGPLTLGPRTSVYRSLLGLPVTVDEFCQDETEWILVAGRPTDPEWFFLLADRIHDAAWSE